MYHLRTPKIVILFCVLCLFCGSFSGCDSSPAERVIAVKNLLNQAAAVNQSVDVGIIDVEKVIADSSALLADPNIPPDMKAEVEQVLNQASAKLIKLKTEKQKVIAALAQYQALLNQVDINNVTPEQEVQLYATGTGQAAQFLPLPYRGYVYLGIALLPLLGTILKIIQQNQQINKGKAVLTNIVTSVDALLTSPIVTNSKEAKQILTNNQTGATADIVDAIHDPMQNTGPK